MNPSNQSYACSWRNGGIVAIVIFADNGKRTLIINKCLSEDEEEGEEGNFQMRITTIWVLLVALLLLHGVVEQHDKTTQLGIIAIMIVLDLSQHEGLSAHDTADHVHKQG